MRALWSNINQSGSGGIKHDQSRLSPGLSLVRADPILASDWSVVTPAVTTGPTSAQMSASEFPQSGSAVV